MLATAFIEVDFVYLGIKAVIMGAQGFKDLPDNGVTIAFVQSVFRFHAVRNDHGDYDVPVFFALGAAHDPPHGLDYIHLGIFGGEKQHGIQRRNIHALGETFYVGDDTAVHPVGRNGFHPRQFVLALRRPHAAVYMVGLDGNDLGALFRGQGAVKQVFLLIENVAEMLCNLNARTKGDGGVHRGRVGTYQLFIPDGPLGQCVYTADQF